MSNLGPSLKLNYTFVLPIVLAQAAQPSGIGVVGVLLIIVIIIAAIGLPLAYFVLRRPTKNLPSLLLVSTDEEARMMVIKAAKNLGYRAVSVFRYEDALDKLRQDMTLEMIVVDDSVPQYEAGLLLSMLQRLPIGVRPLILIHDNSEIGQTSPSYRAEVVVPRPVTEKAIEAAIKQVANRMATI
jgi:CheY-like chemotaxis protein